MACHDLGEEDNRSVVQGMRKFLILLLFIVLANISSAQKPRSASVGIALSGVSYLGDLNKIPFQDLSYGVGGFYRHTIDSRFLLSVSASYLKIKGSGQLFNGSIDQSFSNTAYDLSGTLEFNFKPFLVGNKKYKDTPYVFAGLGTAYYTNTYIPFLISIPFGFGYKVNLTNHLIMGATYSFRKTFTDKLDYLPFEVSGAVKQNNYFGNADWFTVFGIYLAYKINYRMKCPAFD